MPQSFNEKLQDATYILQGRRLRQLNWVAMRVSQVFTTAFNKFAGGSGVKVIEDSYTEAEKLIGNLLTRVVVVSFSETFKETVEAMPAGLRKALNSRVTEARDNRNTNPKALPVATSMPVTPPHPGAASLWQPLTIEEIEDLVFDTEWPLFLGKNQKPVIEVIKKGLSQGLTHRDIAKQIQSNFNRDKVSAARIARTESARVNLIAQEDSMRKALPSTLQGWVYTATLDSRTRPHHAALDGVEYTDKEPRPLLPDGANCRCVYVPVTKSWTAIGIPELEGLLGGDGRASMDGKVAPSIKYPKWFDKQSAGRQSSIIGKKRFNQLKGRSGKVRWNAYAQSPGSPAKRRPQATIKGNRATAKPKKTKV